MSLRKLPMELFRMLVRLYAVALGGGLLFGALTFLKTYPRFCPTYAAIAAMLWLAFGALIVGYFLMEFLTSKGMPRWKGLAMLMTLTLMPGAFVYVSPIWGAIAYAVMIPALLWYCLDRSTKVEPNAC